MSFRVVRLFGVASLQGERVEGKRSWGVAPGGAFDGRSRSLANALVGNVADELCLELGLGVATLIAENPMIVASVGCRLKVGDSEHTEGASLTVNPGDTVELLAPSGARSYFAVAGGWISLDGKERLVGGGIGDGKDRVCELHRPCQGNFRLVAHQDTEAPMGSFKVTRELDRTGIRIEGSAPKMAGIRSEPVTMGTVQSPPGGGLIVLGPDGPTVGGYAKLGAVIRADWDRLGQLKPGDELTFEAVSLGQARAEWSKYKQQTENLVLLTLDP